MQASSPLHHGPTPPPRLPYPGPPSPPPTAPHHGMQEADVTEDEFVSRMGVAGTELLKRGLASLVDDVHAVMPYFTKMATNSF